MVLSKILRMDQKISFLKIIFFPLISEFSTYRGLESAAPENLPVATKMAESVICLPMHHGLREEDIERVIEIIVRR